ncbi:copper chaperone PCu(A)C [Nisaea acidiphila]|uniref:Copper chaperone PCu(A)C n=1 Tax=Nisaea acidiphila TaxID=1862145 RepID=A0A9J7AXJ0_9PROT|nr:copper chaperone PCu(A)C [Nisaea acidiphila]UUX51790.1 copper chaperone PCu(A)C [Nisaea acidiphila]
MKLSVTTIARVAALAILTLPLFGGLAPVCAHEFKVGEIMIDHPWARATPGRAKNGAGFMKLMNHGGAPDRLMEARSDVAERVELHTHIHENGVMKMRPSGPIEVPAHGHVMLEPGSYHVMFLGLTAPLAEGTKFPVTLVFEKAGEVTVELKVESVGAGAGGMKMNHGAGHGMKKN